MNKLPESSEKKNAREMPAAASVRIVSEARLRVMAKISRDRSLGGLASIKSMMKRLSLTPIHKGLLNVAYIDHHCDQLLTEISLKDIFLLNTYCTLLLNTIRRTKNEYYAIAYCQYLGTAK